jgi:hypothetical protein
MWINGDDDDVSEDEDVPWADPQIRFNYEASLGRFILAFNELDYFVSGLVSREYIDRKITDLCADIWGKSFYLRLEILEALASTSRLDSVRELPYAEVRELNAHRNKLAHGYFDQNPFHGDYKVLLRKKAHDFPVERIDSFAKRLAEIAGASRDAYYMWEFVDLI